MSRLFVLGNAGLDIGLDLPALPRPGETVLGRAGGRAPGGKGLNQAVVAARTDLVRVSFYAPVGDDPEGRHIARALDREPFAALDLPILPAQTDVSILMVLPDGENAIVSAGDCAHALSRDAAEGFASRCEQGDWLLLQGNLRPEVMAAAIATAHERAARVIMNTAPVVPGLAALLPQCDLIVANATEARQLMGDAPMPTTAIVTLGAAGCQLTRTGAFEHFPAIPVTAIDTTGAGDTFCGVLAASLAAGRDLIASIAAAQPAAALTVTRPGAYASLPSASELRTLLTEQDHDR